MYGGLGKPRLQRVCSQLLQTPSVATLLVHSFGICPLGSRKLQVLSFEAECCVSCLSRGETRSVSTDLG